MDFNSELTRANYEEEFDANLVNYYYNNYQRVIHARQGGHLSESNPLSEPYPDISPFLRVST